MKKTRKHLEHICANCWYFQLMGINNGICMNCDSPCDIRAKTSDEVCDGGGLGAEDFGFRPCER